MLRVSMFDLDVASRGVDKDNRITISGTEVKPDGSNVSCERPQFVANRSLVLTGSTFYELDQQDIKNIQTTR